MKTANSKNIWSFYAAETRLEKGGKILDNIKVASVSGAFDLCAK